MSIHRLHRQTIDRLIIGLIIVSAGLSAYALWQMRSTDKQQALVAKALAGEPEPDGASPAVRIARAVYLTGDQQFEAALKIYQSVESAAPNKETVRVAQYNAANLNMREAFSLAADNERGRAPPLVDIAKELYRQLLRESPSDAAVRYNLSRALLLVPDPVEEPEGLSPPRDAERAITTMRGYSPGMP